MSATKREGESVANPSSTKKQKPLGSSGVRVSNPFLANTEVDYLYHLGLDSGMDLAGEFGDVRFVLMGGSRVRAKRLARQLYPVVYGVELGEDEEPPTFGKQERYALYKVGPVVACNHGMGMASMSIALVELTKLFHYAGASDVAYIRIGTSGGLGVPPGTCVVATSAVNGKLKPVYEVDVLGETREYPAVYDADLQAAIIACAADEPPIDARTGITMGTHEFYEGQGRLDGAFCDYTDDDKMEFLRKAHDIGVKNIEMESTCLAAHARRANIPAALVCTTLLNRLEGDQVTSSPEQLAEYSQNAQTLVLRYVKKVLTQEGLLPVQK